MKRLFYLSFVAVLATACHCEDPAPNSATGLAGSWQLVKRQCYCIPGPTPNEKAIFTGTDFKLYANNALTTSGTYSSAVGTICGISTRVPVLRFTATSGQHTNWDAIATVSGDTLVLDYGAPCDAPRDTYQRLP